MHQIDEIHIDLVSNTSLDKYPDNSLTSFTNELFRSLRLEGDWEVGILEIFHPTELESTQKKSVRISIMRDIGGPVKHRSFTFEYSVSDKIEKIIEQLNETFATMNIQYTADETDYFGARSPEIKIEPIKITPVDKDKVYRIHPGQIEGSGLLGVNKVKFMPIFHDPTFLKTLGFESKAYHKQAVLGHKAKADSPPIKPWSTNLLFVYTDIVREHFVGDSMSNCLRAIPLRAGQDKILSAHTFAMPYYFPIRYGEIKNISILLTDETGTPLKFTGGRTLVTLHFRKRLYKGGVL